MPGDKNHPVSCSCSEAQGESLFWAKEGGLGGVGLGAERRLSMCGREEMGGVGSCT